MIFLGGTMDKPRGRAYVWASWLPKLLAGEEKCLYRLWYKAQHKYDKLPDDPERADFFNAWTAKHDALVQDRAHRLRDEGWTLRIEEDAKFTLKGDRADLAGKPDIVALRSLPDAEPMALVIDGKSGRKRSSDHWQVRLYMWALPLAWLRDTQYRVKGEVEYPDGPETVRALDVTAIAKLMNVAASPTSPIASPSESECRHCDIASCRFRHVPEVGDARGIF
jgi:hypothetical protein